jgi:hypothetical protein
MVRYLTDYSIMHAEQTVAKWRALLEHLITKHNDGYQLDEQGKAGEPGYPEAWLREVVRQRGEHSRIPAEKPAKEPAR